MSLCIVPVDVACRFILNHDHEVQSYSGPPRGCVDLLLSRVCKIGHLASRVRCTVLYGLFASNQDAEDSHTSSSYLGSHAGGQTQCRSGLSVDWGCNALHPIPYCTVGVSSRWWFRCLEELDGKANVIIVIICFGPGTSAGLPSS